MAIHKAHASPTKDFFVRMITKDISLVDCILDLIDNCLDGARKVSAAKQGGDVTFDYTGFHANITFDAKRFQISDNCGGIKIAEAIDYAFHFGRRPNAPSDGDYSIGLYGIGMKRAVFKIGTEINIFSSTISEAFTTQIDVDEWLHRDADVEAGMADWDFELSDAKPASPGTEISVTGLRPEVIAEFSNPTFMNSLSRIVSRDYSQFIEKGFQISINKRAISAFPFTIRESESFKPFRLRYTDQSGVQVEIFAGMGGPPPDDLSPTDRRNDGDYYGWFVLCNDRVVVAADKSEQTVWGDSSFPNWHFQYNGFIGVVSFESKDPSLLPWRTTKRDVDTSNPTYRRAIEKMKEATRAWINYTNERKSDIVKAKEHEALALPSPLFKVSSSASLGVPKVSKLQSVIISSIQYTKPSTDIAKVKALLGNKSMSNARAGEMTFDYYLASESEE